MFATFVNIATVLIGSSIGLLLKKGLSQKIADQMTKALGLCCLFIGFSGALVGENTLVTIISMVLGVFIGESLDLDAKLTNIIEKIEHKYTKDHSQNNSLSKAFINSSLLFCVGSMTIVGSLNAGFSGDYSLILTKSVLDFCSSIIFASTMGIGVMFSILTILFYQGGLTLLASFVAPLLATAVINEMTCVGSIIVIGTGLNLIGLTDFKLMNYIPATFLPIILCMIL